MSTLTNNNSLIIESTVFQEPQIINSGQNRVIFRLQLQDADTPNQNKRIYPKKVLMSAMNECRERMKRRAFLGELDHPSITGNDSVDGVRQSSVSLKEVSHIIRDFEFNGNKLIGELESTNTPNGKILFALLKDSCGIGVSMRGMASLTKKNGYNVVQDPLVIVSYDAVSTPSHKSAIVNFSEMRFEHKSLLTESKNQICYGGMCFLPNYFDKLVESKMIKFYKKWY